MKLIIQYRLIILALFCLTLAAAIYFSKIDLRMEYLVTSFLNHIFLFLFLLSESFGEISIKRHMALRLIARILLFLTGLTMINIVYLSMIVLLS